MAKKIRKEALPGENFQGEPARGVSGSVGAGGAGGAGGASEAGLSKERTAELARNKKYFYAIAGSMIIVFSALAFWAYLSVSSSPLPGISSGTVVVVAFLIIAAVLFEILMKPSLVLWPRMEKRWKEQEEMEMKKKNEEAARDGVRDDSKNGPNNGAQPDAPSEAQAEKSGGEPKAVVTSILVRDGKILLLKRSDRVGTYRGQWAGVSGHIEKNEKPEDRALIEIEEETGIRRGDVRILLKGEEILIKDGNALWRVHPFLVETKSEKIRLDWEHTEYAWVSPDMLDEYRTVPNLPNVVKSLLKARK